MGSIIVIGGSIMGSSFAYHMAVAGHADSVTVIEPDPTYEFAAAPRSAGGVRLMHTLPENIHMSLYGQEVYRNFATLMDVDGEPGSFPYRDKGYLHLVAGAEAVATIEQNWKVQTSHGAKNELLSAKEVGEKFPHLRTDDIDAGLWGPQDGFIDPYMAVTGFRRKAQNLGVRYLKNRVIRLDANNHAVTHVTLNTGESLQADVVVNLAGCWAPEICAMVGVDIPVKPACRLTFYYEAEEELASMPLAKDYSGIAFRPEGRGFASVAVPPREANGFRWELTQHDHDHFENVLWPALANRVPAFERLKVKRSWTGHYALNHFDGNTLIGTVPNGPSNFFVATGFSGAGLQKGPAIGRALSELILTGHYQTIDLTRLSFRRLADDAPLYETGFIA